MNSFNVTFATLAAALTTLLATLLTAIVFSAAIPSAAHADTYRWIDDNGVVNYAERKPRDVPSERVTRIAETKKQQQRSAGASAAAAAPTSSQAASGNSPSGNSPSGSKVPLNNRIIILSLIEVIRDKVIMSIKIDTTMMAFANFTIIVTLGNPIIGLSYRFLIHFFQY